MKGEYYHIYNRGVDHRPIVLDENDADRFFDSLRLFNTATLTGSIFEFSLTEQADTLKFSNPLVDIISYCLNPNHFHICLKQNRENGISELMKRLAGGYSYYFNKKHKRTGSLFEGRYKAKHINDNDYLVHVASYVALNDKVHGLGDRVTKLVRSSWEENTSYKTGICSAKIIDDQFSKSEFKKFALEALELMKSKRADYTELKGLVFD